MKRIIAIIVALSVMIAPCSVGAYADENYSAHMESLPVNSSIDASSFGISAVENSDIKNNFSNYAERSATEYVDGIDVSTHSFYSRETDTLYTGASNVVGIVQDFESQLPISGATVSVNGTVSVTTGSDGRFQIPNMPDGVYDWRISADGYNSSLYSNYSVDHLEGTTIFTFDISTKKDMSQDFYELHRGEQKIPPETNIDYTGTYGVSTNATSFSSPPSVATAFKIPYNGSVTSVRRQAYIGAVVSSELYGASYYSGKGLNTSQIKALNIAQAVVANTFLEYALSEYSNHSGSYKVCSSTCCQVYNPTKVTSEGLAAATAIFNKTNGVFHTTILMYHPSSSVYKRIWGAYFSSCGGRGTLTHFSQPSLKAVTCTDLATGAGGHRYGMCQMGTAYRAKNTSGGYVTILQHYFKNISIAECNLV